MDPQESMQTLQSAYDELLSDFSTDGIRITLERTISFSNNKIKYGLRIERERQTASGRQGKPVPILLLVNNEDESPAEMLRTLADILEQERADSC